MVSKENNSAVKRLMGRLDCGTTYDHHVPSNLANYYEYLDYFAMSAETLNTLIEKNVVHEAIKDNDGNKVQEIKIFHRFVGSIDHIKEVISLTA